MHTRRRSRMVQQGGLWVPGLLVALLGLCPAVRAEDPAAAEGQCISVRSPLGSEEVNRIKEVTNWVLDHAKERGDVKLIYDFNPKANGPASTSEFGPCNELAEFILNQRDVTTVAFVHGDVTRHTVLPVLACKEIILSADARLGPVVLDNDPPLTDTKRQGYLDVIKGRSLCPALVLKLLDRDMEVLPAVRKGAAWYIDARRVQEEREKDGVVVTNPVPVIGKGAFGYTKTQAQTYGLCQRSMETRQEVVRAYNLPPSSLREDSLVGQNPVVWRFTVSGTVTEALTESVERRIRTAVGNPERRANLIILQLECAGGDVGEALKLAEFLHQLKDDQGVLAIKTVAYIPGQARDTAAIVALGCSEIVMKKDADIGDLSLLAEPGGAAEDGGGVDSEKGDGLRLQQLKKLAEDQGYPTVLIRAMVYPQLGIHEVVSRKGQSRWWLLSDAELRADQESKDPQWTEVRQIKPGGPDGKPLVLSADLAGDHGVRLARYVVDDAPSLYAKYGLKENQIHTGNADWLDDLAYVLRLPAMSIFLVMLGITCLVLELKMPGVGLPGVIAALCFVLFFWAHAHDWGITALAIMLFLLGLVLIGVEIFVMPGVAVVGISGAVLIVGSLTLVTLEKWPQTSHEWLDLGTTMATFGGCLVGSVVAALVLAWYLPHIPYVNRIILKPPGEAAEEMVEEASEPGRQPDLAPLLGAIGVAATPLRPAGKVKFGDEFIDVVAEGSFVPPGSRVQVIEIEGYRVVVKEV